MGLNTRNRPGARRGERLAGQSAAGGRRLAIELCEQRLALSTTAGGVAALLEGPALDDEGGAVVVQGLEFAAGDATALASMKFAFTGGFDLDEAAGAISAVRHRVLFNTGGEQPGRPWPLVLNGTGLQVTDNAFADYDSSPFSPISGELEIAVGADAATTLERAGAAIDEFGSMTRVLPIAPPQEAPLDDGGAILVTAFAERTPWGAPARGDAALAARDGRAEERLSPAVLPAPTIPAASLRGRAVVFEVAALESATATRAPGASMADVPGPGQAAVMQPALRPLAPARSDSPPAGSGAAGPADAANRVRLASRGDELAPWRVSLPVHAARPKVAAAQQAAHAVAQRERAAAVAAIDAAFADAAGDGLQPVDEAAALASFSDSQHRRLLAGTAAALFLAAGPLGKLLKHRLCRDGAIELPRKGQRRGSRLSEGRVY